MDVRNNSTPPPPSDGTLVIDLNTPPGSSMDLDHPSSPLHLSVSSSKALGWASQMITSETRMANSDTSGSSPSPTPLRDGLGEAKENSLNLPYDLSYPSLATNTSSRPRGILHHAFDRAPPNSPEPLADRSNMNLLEPPYVYSTKVQNLDPEDVAPPITKNEDPFSQFDPLPRPRFDLVRPWLKGMIRRTGINRSHSAPDNVFCSPSTPTESPHSPHLLHTPKDSVADTAFLLDTQHSSLRRDLESLSFDDPAKSPFQRGTISPTETSQSDGMGGTAHEAPITWSQLELEVEDPDWDYPSDLGHGEDALQALCEYGSDQGDMSIDAKTDDHIGQSVEGTNGPLLASPFSSPRKTNDTSTGTKSPPCTPGHGDSPKLPLKFSSPLPSRYARRDPNTKSPFEAFYSSP